MIMCKQVGCVLTLILCAGAAVALAEENVIYQNNGYYENPQNPGYPFYQIVPWEKRITVLHGVQGQTFDFEAVRYDENWQYLGPGDINLITADAGAGQVWITVMGNWNVYYGNEWRGARDVKHVNLGASGVTGEIGNFYITQGLGADGDTVADTVTGNWWVYGSITHDIVVGYFDARIAAASFDGDLDAWAFATHTGSLYIGDD
jgi:hypothetical protein